MSTCYHTEKLQPPPGDPLLPSVSRAYILKLIGNDRLTDAQFHDLGSFCRETVVQNNASWKTCRKANVQSTATDLIHAYRAACDHCRDLDGPVLILEDDAQILDRRPEAYADVDEFVRSKSFDVYSLGSFGEFDRSEDDGSHRRFKGKMGFSQAIIWNASARALLLSRPADDVHIDVHTLSAMSRKFTYRTPLVVQLFPTTENMATWCMRCGGGKAEAVIVRLWILFLQRGLGLHTAPSGWYKLYNINACLGRVKAVASMTVLLVGALVAFFLVRGICKR